MKSTKKINTRITTDLGDPSLILLLKTEAQMNNTSMREVLIKALESYFSHSLETKALTMPKSTIDFLRLVRRYVYSY
jgi:hypothetical protein